MNRRFRTGGYTVSTLPTQGQSTAGMRVMYFVAAIASVAFLAVVLTWMEGLL